MTRSRFVLFGAMTVVVVGVVAGLGALWMSPARAAVGPLAGEALILPSDARFVMGFDVKRFTASPFYERFATKGGLKPEALQQLEEKTGLNPARDIDHIVVAGSGKSGTKAPGLAVAIGRFDLYKLGRAIETEGKATGTTHEGVTVYSFADDEPGAVALAFLDEATLVFGAKDQVIAAVGSRTRNETPLKNNKALMGLVEKVRPGSTFWMVGDQSLLASLPTSVPVAVPAPGPAPGASADATASMTLPALTGLTVTGDLDPQVSLAIVGEARDALAAKNLADVVRGFVAMASLQAQQKPELQQLASAISVATEENRVLVNARLPYELLEALQPKPRPAVATAPKPAPVK
jgi:hypothetical protein